MHLHGARLPRSLCLTELKCLFGDNSVFHFKKCLDNVTDRDNARNLIVFEDRQMPYAMHSHQIHALFETGFRLHKDYFPRHDSFDILILAAVTFHYDFYGQNSRSEKTAMDHPALIHHQHCANILLQP